MKKLTHRTNQIIVSVFLLLSASITQISSSHEYETIYSLDKPIHVERNDQAIAAISPDFQFVTQGALTVAVAPSDPPISFYAKDTKTAIGADPDFALAIAESLGLDLKLIPITWIDWSLGLTGKKYDAVLANMGVTEARKAKFDFSTYRLGLHGFYVKNSSKTTSIVEPKDASGLRIIVGAGTNQERILLRWNKELIANGLSPITLQYYDDGAVSLLAIQSNRADVIVQPNAQLVYLAARDGNIRSVGTLSAGWPDRSDVAVVTRKNSGLAEAITLAINGLSF